MMVVWFYGDNDDDFIGGVLAGSPIIGNNDDCC